MNDLEKKIAELNERADAVSADIRKAEAMLRELPLSTTETFGPLTWNADKKRIMMNDKPLIENKLKARIDGHWYLSCLVNNVILSAQDALPKIKCSKCQDTGEIEGGEFCQECCEHGEYDHGICGYCGADCLDDLVGAAEYAFEGER